MRQEPNVQGSVTSEHFNLKYSVEGEGIPTLVIGSATYYPRTFSQALRRQLKIAFVDHRGFAASSSVPVATDGHLEKILLDTDAMRKKIGFDQVVVMGHSGHGYMALEYAKRFPENVSHLVMIGTGPSHSYAHSQYAERYWDEAVCPERKLKLAQDLNQLSSDITACPENRFIHLCLRLAAKSWYDHEFDASFLWKDVKVNMSIIDFLWGEVFRDIDIVSNLSSFRKPVFLALGRFDYLVPPYPAWDPYRKHFRDLTVRVFDKSSHTPQFEQSDLFDAELLKWLAQKT